MDFNAWDNLSPVEYDLDTKLIERFGLKIKDASPVRSVFLIDTDKGKKILKKVGYDTDKIYFIYYALEYINNCFPKVFRILKAVDGEPYVKWGEDLYCVLDLIDGRETEFFNPIDVNIAAQGISKFHNAGVGFLKYLKQNEKEKMAKDNSTFGKEIEKYKENLEKMKELKHRVSCYKYKNEFDSMFLDKVDYYMETIYKSIELLEDTNYDKLCTEEDNIVICHNDLAHHNIIIKDEEAYFIDLDYCSIDIRVKDLNNFINKAIKNYAFDIDRVKNIIYNYKMYYQLNYSNIEILYAMLYFPSDFNSIVLNYYENHKNWGEDVFLDRLKKRIELESYRKEFLNKFYEVFIKVT